MFLFPRNLLVIDSPLTPDEALVRLRHATGKPRWVKMPFQASETPFEGRIDGNEVRIQRAIGYQNAWLPRIRGHVQPLADGCRLTGTLSIHPLVALFTVVWFAAAVATMVPALMSLRVSTPAPAATTALIMLLVGATVFGLYVFESRAARARLAELLNARSPGGSPAATPSIDARRA
jgi:hypothetical protein